MNAIQTKNSTTVRSAATVADILGTNDQPPRQTTRRGGYMVYLDKSTPVLVQTTTVTQAQEAQKLTERKGQQSILRQQTPGSGRLQ